MKKTFFTILAFSLILNHQAFSQSLFAKAKEDAGKSLAVYKSVLKDYFSRWSTILEAAPEKDEQGQPAIHVNPSERLLGFSMKISVNESAYSKWKTTAFAKLAEAGIHETEEGGLNIGGKWWAFPNEQGIDKWFEDKDISMPEMTFRAMLVDSEGGVIRSAEYHMARKRKVVTTEYEAMLRSWTEVSTNSVETLPLTWSERLKDCQDWKTTDWLDKAKDEDSCFIGVAFKKLTDEEMERAVGVKCVVLGPKEIENEQIAAAREKWNGREKEARKVVLEILADMIKVPGMDCALGRHKVKQSQWEAVMGSNPSETKGADKPVVGVWDDLLSTKLSEFLVRLNAHPIIADAGIRFRLPYIGEWKAAALAGSPGEFRKFYSRYGEKYSNRSGANTWGFHDMLVGCWEQVHKVEKDDVWENHHWLACTGGQDDSNGIELLKRPIQGLSDSSLGFRLCVDWSETMQKVIDDAEEELEKELEKLDAPIDRHAAIQSIVDGMVAVPGTDIKIGKFEVTQLQWEAVMGSNPSKFKGENRPVENVTRKDVEQFLERLNATEEVSGSGFRFRLPTDHEWEKAALGGGVSLLDITKKMADGLISNDEAIALLANQKETDGMSEGVFGYGLLADGSQGLPDDVAWHGGDETHNTETSIPSTANGMTHPVGNKKPNAFGFYDLHGNVAEVVTRDDYFKPFVAMGGSWDSKPQDCSAYSVMELYWAYGSWESGDAASDQVGIRLCTDKK